MIFISSFPHFNGTDSVYVCICKPIDAITKRGPTAPHCHVGPLHYSVDLRTHAYTEPVPFKIRKTRHKISSDIRTFLQCITVVGRWVLWRVSDVRHCEALSSLKHNDFMLSPQQLRWIHAASVATAAAHGTDWYSCSDAAAARCSYITTAFPLCAAMQTVWWAAFRWQLHATIHVQSNYTSVEIAWNVLFTQNSNSVVKLSDRYRSLTRGKWKKKHSWLATIRLRWCWDSATW